MKRMMIVAAALLVALPAMAAEPLKVEIKAEEKTTPLVLEVAATHAQRVKGLSHRQTLKPHDGMIFFFPEPVVQQFWMKDTLIPLDILFLNAEKRIVYIAHGEPLSETPLGPKSEIIAVIEIDGGRAEKEGIEVGNDVAYTIPANVQIQ